jgi:hypothetical protein
MEYLPTELKVMILHSVGDFISLYSIIRASRSMQEAFKLSRSSILASTLRQSLPTELLKEAYAVKATSQLISHNMRFKKLTSDKLWLAESLRAPQGYPTSKTEGLDELARLHFAVEWLTNDLCGGFARAQTSVNFTTLPLLPEEKVRIYRAFYRLQLLCNYFLMNTINMEWADLRREFLGLLSLWEVAELVCVNQYLRQKLQSTFDVSWDHLGLCNGKSNRPQKVRTECEPIS